MAKTKTKTKFISVPTKLPVLYLVINADTGDTHILHDIEIESIRERGDSRDIYWDFFLKNNEIIPSESYFRVAVDNQGALRASKQNEYDPLVMMTKWVPKYTFIDHPMLGKVKKGKGK